MKHIGDHNWLNQYIGTPYEAGGRGPETFDCYGLCMAIYSDVFGVTLPDWQGDVEQIVARAGAIDEALSNGTWTDLEDPVDGCFVVCYRTRAAYHLGLYFAGGVVHALDGCGTIFEPLSRFADRFTAVRFGDWRP